MQYRQVKQMFFGLLLMALVLATACTSTEREGEPVSDANIQVHVFPGETEKRLISDENIVQDNCDGSAETSQTVTREHTVQYTLEVGSELTVSAEGNVGIPKIGEVGLGAEVAAHYSVTYGRQETISRAVTVAAAPKSHIQHTIQQFEVWDTGEVLIVAGEQSQRLPYSFRRDFSIEAVAPANIGCSSESSISDGTQEPTVVEPTVGSGETLTKIDMDNLFGVENWFCFPDRQNGVGLHLVQSSFEVVSPLRYVDTNEGRFSPGQTVPPWSGGTAELTRSLLRSECPEYQLSPLAEWDQARNNETQQFNKTRIDNLFGSGNWSCIPDYSFGVKVLYLNEDTYIQYPLTTADGPSGKYGVGDTIPGGTEITAWLAGPISRSECP
ncbi:MAG: hypothetical protein KC413_00840 [Anaerolineales bacterium]|nr:hypothetical protein [Anaerolineales bacterium]